MKNWYRELKGRFLSFPSHIQILHLVSELQKAQNLMKNNRVSACNHLYRAIILLDYITADTKWAAKRRECLRLREVIGSLIVGKQPMATIDQILTASLLLDAQAYRTLRIQNTNDK